MASSDRSRSDRLEPLSGRMVSQMQAVSSPVPGESMSSSSPDVPTQRHSMEVSQHNSQLNMPQSVEINQHNHQVNVPISQEYHQHVLQDNRQLNVQVSTDPLVVAQAHQAVADARNSAFQYACHVQSQAQDYALEVQTQANAFVESQTRDLREEALGEFDRLQNQAALLVDRIKADASQQISQAHGEAREASEMTIRVRTEALETIHQAQEEARHVVLTQHQEVQKRDHMLSEMQSQMQKLMMKIRQQDVLIQELSNAKRVEVEALQLQEAPTPQHPVASPSLFNLSHTEPSPVNPSLPVQSKSGIPLPISIATPKASSHHCAEAPMQPYQCIQSGLPTAGGAMHQAPPPSWMGQGMPTVPTMAVNSMEDQIRELTVQMATMQDMLLKRVSPNHGSSKGRPNQGSSKDSPDHGSSSSSSAASSRRGRHGGGGGGSPGGSPGGTPNNDGGSESSDSNEDPYRREKRLMRVKHYESMKLPPIPQDAAKCRSFRNQMYSLVCKMAKGDETPVFNWISECNTAEEETILRTNDFPVLDRVLGAKLLELAAKNPKFALEFQTIQEKAQQRGRLPKGRYLLWYIFQKFRLDRDRGTALSQHHLLSLKISSDQTVKSLEEFKQKYDYCMGSLEVGEYPNEASLRSLLFENLKNHPRMALAIDKFRQAIPGSRKRTSAWLYGRLTDAIEISQVDVNSSSVDKALTAGGEKVSGAQAELKRDKPPKQKPPKEEKPGKKENKPDKKGDKAGKEKPKKEEVEAAAADAKGKGKGKGKDKGKKEPLTKEEKSKRPCMYFAYDSCVHGEKCEYLHDKNNLYKGPKPRTKSSTSAGVAAVSSVAAATSIPTAEAAVREAKKECRKVFKRMSPTLLPHVFSKAITAIMAAIACLNPVSLSNTNHIPAAIAPVEMSFLLDSGAGRNLMSKRDMPEGWNDRVIEPAENLVFRTGGGERKASESISLQGNISGKNDFFVLKECLSVLSLGIQIEQHRRGFVWLPDQMPYLIKADRIQDMTHFVPESAKIYASEVRENVPVIVEQVEALPAPPEDVRMEVDSDAGPSTAPEGSDAELDFIMGKDVEGGESFGSRGPDVPVPDPPKPVAHPDDIPKAKGKRLKLKEDWSLPHFGDELDLCLGPGREPGDAPLDDEDDEDFPWEPSLREKLQQEARTPEHLLTHYPKNRYCEICCRSKMTMRYHRRKAVEEETPPLHYGHRMRADHLTFGSESKKGSEGESSCLVVYDEFSGAIGSYPLSTRMTDSNITSLQRFAGARGSDRSQCFVKTDCAQELTKAVEFLGWISESGIANDPIHNAKLESMIRRIKEGVRSIHLKSGLPHEMWPRSIEYFTTALSFTTKAPVHPNDTEETKAFKEGKTCYEVANKGDPFEGYRIPLGALVYYKPPKHRELPAFDPRTLPGIFCGWRLDPGYKFRGVHYILDYESLRENRKGCGRPIQVYTTELVMPEVFVFPLEQRSISRLALFSEPGLPKIEPREALPFDEEVPEVPKRKRRTYVTLERVIRFGKTVGCKGCDRIAEGVRHTGECHARIEKALEDEKLAKEAERAKRDEKSVDASTYQPLHPLSHSSKPNPRKTPQGRCNLAPLEAESKPDLDYWEYDDNKNAWKRVHLRPRKRLFTPVGNDCPFDPSEVLSERKTLWKCRGKTSWFEDNWQEGSPTRRISSKSWVGETYFYPKFRQQVEHARIMAVQANVKEHCCNEPLQGIDAVAAILNDEGPSPSALEAAKRQETVKPPRERRLRGNKAPMMFEFCCSDNSKLGEVNKSKGIDHIRLSLSNCDLEDETQIKSLLAMVDRFKGADMWASIPCGPWSPWQQMALHRYGKKYQRILNMKRQRSRKLLAHFFVVAERIMLNGGHVCFEWPKGSRGWILPELVCFFKKHGFFEAICDGCAFGLVDQDGKPHLKSWRIMTTSWKLAKDLGHYRCCHPKGFKHSELEGSKTGRSAFYTDKMAECISASLYPDKDVPALPTIPFVQSEHVPNEPLDLGVHQLIDRRDWHRYPGFQEAINNERDGLLENETWSYDRICSKDDLINSKKKFHLGRLMTILSLKHAESPTLRKLKARIVFRGDQIVDQDNNIAVLQELKVNPSGITSINFNLAYGALKGHKSTQSDVVKAYTQSLLNTVVETWVLLPAELIPSEYSHIKQPCVPLRKALYGHPESGYHWDARFKEIMVSMGGSLDNDHQSNYVFKNGLLLTLYVDDVLLSGPEHLHSQFWTELQKYIAIEEPAPVDRCLGRKHLVKREGGVTTIAFDMEDFILQSCEAYTSLTGKTLKEANSPYVADGSLVETDWDTKGQLEGSASKVLMKLLWLARLARPDLMKGICDLTRRVTCWSRADDKRLYRLVCYLWSTKTHKLFGQIADPVENLRLVLYTDADHASGIDFVQSTSGGYLCIEGPSSFWPLSWMSKKQTSTSRSTTEAEIVSLAAGLFDALPTLDFADKLLGKDLQLECRQDNSAVISIVHLGYSPKLRHVTKTHRINLASLYEVFDNGTAKLVYVKTTQQRADPMTKPIASSKWGVALEQLNVLKPSDPIFLGDSQHLKVS